MAQGVRGTVAGIVWSVDYNGKSVFDLMEAWPKMPYAHVKMTIANEGGYIDHSGIIHKGSATTKVGEIA